MDTVPATGQTAGKVSVKIRAEDSPNQGENLILNTVILRRWKYCSKKRQLRWIEHVLRMKEVQLPKVALYGKLAYGFTTSGGQKTRYKDPPN